MRREVHSLIKAGVLGTKAVIPEEQTMAFEYVYADDMGRAVDMAITKQGLPADAAYNLSWGRAITFDELVQAVRTSLPELTLEIKPGTPPISRMTALDTRRAKEELSSRADLYAEGILSRLCERIPRVYRVNRLLTSTIFSLQRPC